MARAREREEKLVAGTRARCLPKEWNGFVVMPGHSKGPAMLEPRLPPVYLVSTVQQLPEGEIGGGRVAGFHLATAERQPGFLGEVARR